MASAKGAYAAAAALVFTASLLSMRGFRAVDSPQAGSGARPVARARPAAGAAATPQVTASDAALRRALGGALERLKAGEARLIYYHVHKSGGSSMCNALVKANASLMGCIDEHKDLVVAHHTNAWCNCNGHRHLVPTPIATQSPAAVERYLRARRPVAFFNEDGVSDQPYFGPGAVHAIVVRHPVRRYVSHMLHVLTKEDERNLTDIDLSLEALRHHRRPPGESGGIVDNYLTRFAAGWTTLGRPTKAGVWGVDAVPTLTFQHFQTALRNLERMQVVLVLEEIDAAAPLLQALGLPPFAAETRAGTNFSTGGGSLPSELSYEALRHIKNQHEWDLMLYAWCQQRHSRTLEAFQQMQQQRVEQQEQTQEQRQQQQRQGQKRKQGQEQQREGEEAQVREAGAVGAGDAGMVASQRLAA